MGDGHVGGGAGGKGWGPRKEHTGSLGGESMVGPRNGEQSGVSVAVCHAGDGQDRRVRKGPLAVGVQLHAKIFKVLHEPTSAWFYLGPTDKPWGQPVLWLCPVALCEFLCLHGLVHNISSFQYLLRTWPVSGAGNPAVRTWPHCESSGGKVGGRTKGALGEKVGLAGGRRGWSGGTKCSGKVTLGVKGRGGTRPGDEE